MGTSQLAHTDATATAENPPRWHGSWTGTALGGTLGLGSLAFAFRSVDWTSVARLLGAGGLALGLVLLAYLPSVVIDTLAWARLLRRLERPAPFGRLLQTRIATEALRMSLPGGSVLAETLTPPILRTRCGTPLADGVASLAARKCLLGLAHAAFLLTATVVGAPLIDAAARSSAVPWLRSAMVSTALLVLVLSGGASLLLARAGTGEALWRGLQKVPFAPLHRYLEARHAGFGRFDADAARLLRSRSAFATASLFGLAWLAEAGETWLLLHLLGAPVSFTQALPIEAAASILRQAGVVVPAGIGVQEVGYVVLIAATGVPSAAPLAAAFSVAKRLKEALWTGVGYVLLARGRA
jgi:uncharacterized membrane protein YbhN (UPF0104 family)